MAYGTKDREVHLFDSWEGLPEITVEDGNAAMLSGQVVGSPKRVSTVMRQLNIEPSRLHFHKGWFNKTFPAADIKTVALLHVDGDFYDSVRLSLETRGPKVSSGGFIQIDDHDSFVGCTKAVDEFLASRPRLRLECIERHAKVYFIEIP
jgi:O-methyltransferase